MIYRIEPNLRSADSLGVFKSDSVRAYYTVSK